MIRRKKPLRRCGRPKKRRSRSPFKALKTALDIRWSKLTKEIWGHRCAWCGKTDSLTSDHIFNRWKHPTRWIVENAVILCVGCHIFRKKREPAEWYEVVRRERGDELLEVLRNESERIKKPDYEQVKAYLDALERDRPWDKGEGLGSHSILRRAA